MKSLTVTTEGLIKRVFKRNKAKVWHGFGAIPTDYYYLSVDGYWVNGQWYSDHCNTRDNGIIISDVTLDEARVTECLSHCHIGCVLQLHRDNGPNPPPQVDIAIRTRDGWKLLADLELWLG